MKIYLAATYSTAPLIRKYATELMIQGHEVTSRWIWNYHKQLRNSYFSHEAFYARCATDDIQDLLDSDILLFFAGNNNQKGLGGKHVEFGIALALNKPVILIGDPSNVFHYLPCVQVVSSFRKAVKAIRGVLQS